METSSIRVTGIKPPKYGKGIDFLDFLDFLVFLIFFGRMLALDRQKVGSPFVGVMEKPSVSKRSKGNDCTKDQPIDIIYLYTCFYTY